MAYGENAPSCEPLKLYWTSIILSPFNPRLTKEGATPLRFTPVALKR